VLAGHLDVERTGGVRPSLQTSSQVGEHFAAEACADVSHVDQAPVGVVRTEQK
jgi:hypothetical protein